MSQPATTVGPEPAGQASHAVRRAVLLAAGTGTRLQPLTAEIPKCLVEVAGETIIERALRVLGSQGITEAVIVIGHCGEAVRNRLGSRFAGVGISYVEAPDYATTNNIRSLWDARGALDRDLLLIEADLVFDAEVIAALLATPGSSAAVVPVDRAPPFPSLRLCRKPGKNKSNAAMITAKASTNIPQSSS